MKSLNLNKFNNNIDLEKEFNDALKDTNFRNIVDSLNIDRKQLILNVFKLKECANQKTNHNHLDDETFSFNELPGFILTPFVVNGILNFKYVPCKKKSEYLKDIEFVKNGYLFEISKDVRNAKMKDIYTDDKNRVEVIKWLTKFIKDYQKGKTYKGLYLSGNFGSGKSYLVSATLNELVKKGYKAAFVYYPNFLRSLKASFKTDFDEQFEYARKADLLLLDDIGAESISQWSRDEILGPILQYRMDEKLPTFFTSNLSMEELEIHLSESKEKVDKLKAKRIIERIKFLTDNLTLISKNKRN